VPDQTTTHEDSVNEDSVADDVLRGAVEIGGELKLTPGAVYYIYVKQEREKREGRARAEEQYPISKWGKLLVASRRALRRAHRRITAST